MDAATSAARAAMRETYLQPGVGTGSPGLSDSLRAAQERVKAAQQQIADVERAQQETLFATDANYANARVTVLFEAILQFIPEDQQEMFRNMVEEGDRRMARGIVQSKIQANPAQR